LGFSIKVRFLSYDQIAGSALEILKKYGVEGWERPAEFLPRIRERDVLTDENAVVRVEHPRTPKHIVRLAPWGNTV